MKSQIILKKKNISDNVISFLFLLNRINYKKLKSITKRPLLPYYVYYRFLLTSLKREFTLSWHKAFTQSNYTLINYVPGSLLHKRMFFKNVRLLSIISNTPYNSYMWCNSTNKFLSKTPYFNKVNQYPVLGGNNLLLPKKIDFTKEEFLQNSLIIKDNFNTGEILFNPFVFFNISLFQIVEFYKILVYVWILKTLIK